jgi:predicted ATP-grasp superfamily ATP-dependent carboligase
VGRYRLAREQVAEFAALRSWAVAHGVRAVLPMTERSCLLCNESRDAWESAGIRVGCPEPAMLTQALDKARTLEIAEACGVSTPPTLLATSETDFVRGATALGYPCVIKARFSETWVDGRLERGGGTRYVAGPSEVPAAVQACRRGAHWPILQKYVAGQGKGISGVCDRGRPVAMYAHERLRDVRPTGSGSSLRRSVPLDARLREPAERLLRELSWHGPVMVEFRDDGTSPPWLMEVNGRFWGSTQLAIEVGLDVPRYWVELLEGRSLDAVTHYPSGVALRWLWGDVKRFLTILQGRPAGFSGPFPTRLGGLRELFQAQPPRTRLEAWQRDDPWPAVGEWIQGVAELLELSRAPEPSPSGPLAVPSLMKVGIE